MIETEHATQLDSLQLAEARLDTDYLNTMDSSEWHLKLSNPSLVRGIGRKMLSAVGIETSAQKAIQHHERIMGNYAESAHIDLGEVNSVTPDQHADLRFTAVEQRLDRGEVKKRPIETKLLNVNIEPVAGPRQLGVKEAFRQHSKKDYSNVNVGVRYVGLNKRKRVANQARSTY